MDDELHFQFDQSIKECFEDGELILMSCSLYKYNKRQKCQQRAILITSKAIYNINKFEFLAQMISFFKSNYVIRRRINIEKLSAITMSERSSEFVIHVKDEYDYRYSSPQRDKIFLMILKSYEMNAKKPLNFFYRQDLDLHGFTTIEDDMRSGILRMPTDNPILMDRKSFLRRARSKLTLDDFEILQIFDDASQKTMAVEKKDTKKIYFIKSMFQGKEEANLERFVLEQSQSPWIVKLKFIFQTPEKLFLGTKHMSGGDFSVHLRRNKRFDEKRAKFYAAEIILGLEYLHKIGVVYRDLRPENILMDQEGHICLRNFEISQKLELGLRTGSFVETSPEYVSPEMIKGEEYGHSVDWWALGILVFEMLVGLSPFYRRDMNTQKTFHDIREKDPIFPTRWTIAEDAKDFILQLLQKDPEERLGSKGAAEVKKHKWFADVNWELLSEKKAVPPFKPRQLTREDYQMENFTLFPQITSANLALAKKYETEFKDWTYYPEKEFVS